MNLGDFHSLTWGAPLWLWALAAVPLCIALFVWSERRRVQTLQMLVAARLQPALAGSVSLVKRRLHFALVMGALACFALSLAQPRWGFTIEEAKRKGRDVLIAVDTSRSMLANDVKPNRLDRAKLAAQDLINSLQGDRLGLIAFAGSSFLQAPLTVDYSAVLASLNELDTNIIPLGGTNLADAIRAAVEAFGKGESESRVLIVFTDGEDLSADAIDAAKRAADKLHIFTVGVGSADGSLIPVTNEAGGTEFVKGPDGQFVKSRLDERTLSAVAQAANGFYTHLQNSPVEMRRLVEAGLGRLKAGEIDARLSRRPIERYQWPLGLGIALLAASILINERRRKRSGSAMAGALGCAFVALMPAPAQAENGVELFQQKHYAEARQQFEADLKRRPDSAELHFNKGAADYELKDYDKAIEAFGKALTATNPEIRGKAEYNLGTALLQRALQNEQNPQRESDLKNAEQHLGEAIKQAPSIQENAKKNLEIARRELAKPKPTPTPPPQQDQKQDDKKDEKQESKDQQSKDQQSKDQQSKDQQSKDQQSKDQQSKDQQSKDQQSKDQQSKDQQSKDQQSKDQQLKASAGETPQEEKKDLSGEIKANDSKKPEEGEAAEVPVKPGEMSPGQARMLLDSLKGEDEQPFKIKQRSAAPVLKDW